MSGPASRGALASVARRGVRVVPGGPGSRVSVYFIVLTSWLFASATPTPRGAVCGGSSASVVRARAARSRRFGRCRGRCTGVLRGRVPLQGASVWPGISIITHIGADVALGLLRVSLGFGGPPGRRWRRSFDGIGCQSTHCVGFTLDLASVTAGWAGFVGFLTGF